MSKSDDVRWMGEAVELARGWVAAPNPHVGCVIVKDGVEVGRGHSAPAGGDHAEVRALKDAGERARGADVFVTLEPCNHVGRTGACSVALVEAGVRRVVVGCQDTNEEAAGGIEFLREHGIEVEVGVLENECRDVHRVFLGWSKMQWGRTYVMVKAAVTMDGFVARRDGKQVRITGEEAQLDGHRLRGECGCVLVGRGTVEADDPQLTIRLPGEYHQPARVVLDPRKKLTGRERIFGEGGKTYHLTETYEDGKIDVFGVTGSLCQEGIIGVLVEGGPRTIRTFFEEGIVDEVNLYVAPIMFGDGLHWSGGLGDLGLGWRLREVKQLGQDVRLSYVKLLG